MPISLRTFDDNATYVVIRHGDGDNEVLIGNGRTGLLRAFRQVIIDNDAAEYYSDYDRRRLETSLSLTNDLLGDFDPRKAALRSELDGLIAAGMESSSVYRDAAAHLEEVEQDETVQQLKRNRLEVSLQVRTILDHLVQNGATVVGVDDLIPSELTSGAKTIIPQRLDYTYGNFAQWFLALRERYEYEDVTVTVPFYRFS